jgi:hypothetical protein
MQNFRQPYLSKSLREFWKRWHISLSGWWRDYLYIPLGGSRVSRGRRYFNIMLTFAVSGLWHGANWTYIIWGVLHGVFQVAEDFLKPVSKRVPRIASDAFKWLATFSMVLITWVFFRANSVGDAIRILTHLLDGFPRWGGRQGVYGALSGMGAGFAGNLINIALIGVVALMEMAGGNSSFYGKVERAPSIVRALAYSALMFLILALGVYHNGGEFIYFQF